MPYVLPPPPPPPLTDSACLALKMLRTRLDEEMAQYVGAPTYEDLLYLFHDEEIKKCLSTHTYEDLMKKAMQTPDGTPKLVIPLDFDIKIWHK